MLPLCYADSQQAMMLYLGLLVIDFIFHIYKIMFENRSIDIVDDATQFSTMTYKIFFSNISHKSEKEKNIINWNKYISE
jgi:hypothetical protein